jgi:hypothetical protein
MHTAAFRANALLTYAGTALAVLAALASLTGARTRSSALADTSLPRAVSSLLSGAALHAADLVHKEAPVLDVRLAKVERLHALESGNDEARGRTRLAPGLARHVTRGRVALPRARRRTLRFPCMRT